MLSPSAIRLSLWVERPTTWRTRRIQPSPGGPVAQGQGEALARLVDAQDDELSRLGAAGYVRGFDVDGIDRLRQMLSFENSEHQFSLSSSWKSFSLMARTSSTKAGSAS